MPGPFAWWLANMDLMVLCHFISFMASGIVIFLRSVRGTSVIVALLSSSLFTALGVPTLSIDYSWHWTTLMLFSAALGFGSLTLALTAIKVSETLQRRAIEGAATWGEGRLPPVRSLPSTAPEERS